MVVEKDERTSTTVTPCTGPATVLLLRLGLLRAKPSQTVKQMNLTYNSNPVLSPLASSLTNITFFPQDASLNNPAGWTCDTNGGITVNANNFTLVYSSFYRAPSTGLFAICSSLDNKNDMNVTRNYDGPSAFSFTIWEPDVPWEDRKHNLTEEVYSLSCEWF
ncbi:hypothetical protein F4782DRAFT_539903 [Xylaria castorea]|nr:hypothetical protein F4782DRAFT_539903 [Xylaria castorea]